jgi:predicted regulator of Ras-like GTPase activity (Roadblock/LC7/MglB family)
MPLSRTEKIHEILERVRIIDPDIEGVAAATSDGLVIASSLAENLDDERLSAVCAAAATVTRHTAEELDKGDPTEVHIRAPGGYILIMRSGASSYLVGISRRGANLGLILIDMRKAAGEISAILAQ